MSQVNRKRCLFLSTELAGYTLSCMKKLAGAYEAEVHVVHYPVNPVAPFRFNLAGDHLHFYDRSGYTNESLLTFVSSLNPDFILCAGWIDKGYLEVCRKFRNSIPVVVGIDNPWRNTIKQRFATFIGPLMLPRYFNHSWVCGTPQHTYARKLGFTEKSIRDGFYSCDFDLFHNMYSEIRPAKATQFPKRFIFVGRYTKLKGVMELWEAFQQFQSAEPCEWELWCLGKGELEPHFPNHPKIRNFGFVQPANIRRFVEQTGVFILPSHYEHWGVVVHEFAAAGFPLICSSTTSAAETFLEDGRNGYLHAPCSVPALVEVFRKISRMSDPELLAMGDRSAALAEKITPVTWSQDIFNFIHSGTGK